MPAFAVLTLALIAGPPTRADNNQDAPSCVTVEIDGHKALPYDCYQRKMACLLYTSPSPRDRG